MTPGARTRLSLARLAALLLATLVAAAATLGLAQPASAGDGEDEARLYELTNQSRAQNGLGPLAYDAAASGIARGWAQELARSGQLRHNPDLVAQVDAWVTRDWTRLGENVGYSGTVDQVQAAYMNSTGHRANILGGYNRVGIGAARDGGGRLWTTVVFLQGPALPVLGPGGFTDTLGSSHGTNIAKVAAAAITGGYPDGTYRPDAPVTRGQMATFLQRAYGLTPGAGPTFPDVVGTTHEPGVRAVAGEGIATGGADGRFRPTEWLSRGQLAAFLARAEGLDLNAGGPSFCDVAGQPFEREIRAVAAAGIASGGADGCYRPNAPVTRGQMATFLVRAQNL